MIEALGAGELLPQEPTPLDKASKSFCMAKPTKYDVMLDGKKVGGAAQRRTQHGYLHQGSIFLKPVPEEFLEQVLLPSTRVLEGMQQNSYPLLKEGESIQAAKERIQNRLIEVFS